jgi:4-amino-4-deoxy-L-arabinose transferase-like glycosyltransferase
MSVLIKKYPLATVILVSLLMLVSHLGMVQTNIMEARNLISAREMVNDGHWIFTTLNGMPRYEKPPLPTWITAVFMLTGGMQNMFWLRLPVVLVTLLLVYFFYRLVLQMKLNAEQPLNASLILITSFYIFFAGRDNQWDMYTHAFMMVSIFYLCRAFDETGSLIKNVLLAGLFFGCSFLSKGPVSLYALWLPFLLSYLTVYRKNTVNSLKLVLFVVVIGLIIGFSWPLYVKFFDTANVRTALSKQAQNWGDYEVKPFWHYWSFFTQSGVWTVPSFIALMYLYMRRRVQNLKAYNFSFWWTIFSVVLLSFIPEKKMRYLLPVLIPMALNTSFYIQYLIADFKNIKSKIETGIVNFSFGLIGFIGFAAPFVILFIFGTKLSGFITWYLLFTITAFYCAFSIIKGLYKKDFVRVFYTVVLFMCGLMITVIPLSKMYYANSDYYAAANLRATEKSLNIKTYEGDDFVPEITWDYGSYIPNLDNNGNITMPADSTFGLLIDASNIKSYMQKFSNYSFKKHAAVDLNVLSKNSKGYNTRLSKDYFIVQKKLN